MIIKNQPCYTDCMKPITPESAWPSFSDLVEAHRKCRHKKSPSTHQIRFESRLGENLHALHADLQNRKYQPSQAKCFIVPKPKPREIFAAHFRDRIIHHLLVSLLEPRWERRFVHSSFACRKGKGGYQAIGYLDQKARQLSQGGRLRVFALQLDIASFFITIRRSILTELLLKDLRGDSLRWIVNLSFRHDSREKAWIQSPPELRALVPPHKSWFNQGKDVGIPIGNLTSQFGANVYLDGLDHWIYRNLKPAAYLRYMDDLTLLDTDPKRLLQMSEPIDTWLKENRKQCLNPDKTSLKLLSSGISYLGYRLRQDLADGGAISLKAPASKKWDFVRTLKQFESCDWEQSPPAHPLEFSFRASAPQRILSSANARLGFLKHADTYQFRRRAIERLKKQLTNPENLPAALFDPWTPVRIKKPYLAIRLR